MLYQPRNTSCLDPHNSAYEETVQTGATWEEQGLAETTTSPKQYKAATAKRQQA